MRKSITDTKLWDLVTLKEWPYDQTGKVVGCSRRGGRLTSMVVLWPGGRRERFFVYDEDTGEKDDVRRLEWETTLDIATLDRGHEPDDR